VLSGGATYRRCPQDYVVRLEELSTTTDCHEGVPMGTVGGRQIGTATDAVFVVPGAVDRPPEHLS
jgi:hypothetical protein